MLAACEMSGRVRKAFQEAGWDAWSCDLMQTEIPGQHYRGDVRDILEEPWDLVIAFPPCTDLTVACANLWKEKQADGRQQRAIDFFLSFTKLECPWAIENPRGIMSRAFRKPDQYVQPFWFGDPYLKYIGLWLHDLPLLKPTNVIHGPLYPAVTAGSTSHFYGSPEDSEGRARRAITRSRTAPGLAAAMADQWGRV